MPEERHVRLSALSCELLTREYDQLADPGAFGRLAQEIVVGAIKKIHPDAHDNRGAGTPDCKYMAGSTAWDWEIKHDPDGKIDLSTGDVEGMMSDQNAQDHRPRLLVLDMRYPLSIWCFDASKIQPGDFDIDANTDLQMPEEATKLALHMDAILRLCDVDIFGTEEHAKQFVRDVLS